MNLNVQQVNGVVRYWSLNLPLAAEPKRAFASVFCRGQPSLQGGETFYLMDPFVDKVPITIYNKKKVGKQGRFGVRT